jgi:hypothetical protein
MSLEEEHAEEMMEDMDKAYDGCGCPTCKEKNVSCEDCPVCSDVAKKAPCWEGYVMRGMKPAKDGSGRMVPNCVPSKKKESFWGGNFDNRSFSKYNGCCPE